MISFRTVREKMAGISLTFNETRIIGSLIEKAITTPENYPLSLNALVNACNQKSNRDPVVTLDEATVQQTLDELVKKRLVSARSGFGSRVTKYQHRFANTEFSELQLDERELAILCELFLRGPQTPGELRGRASRLCPFTDVGEVETALESLMTREEGALVARLPREPGKRESRYAHLFGSDESPGEQETASEGRNGAANLSLLERRLDEMALQLERLAERVEQLERGE